MRASLNRRGARSASSRSIKPVSERSDDTLKKRSVYKAGLVSFKAFGCEEKPLRAILLQQKLCVSIFKRYIKASGAAAWGILFTADPPKNDILVRSESW